MEAERRFVGPDYGKVVSQDLHMRSGLGHNHRPKDLGAKWEQAVIRVPLADHNNLPGFVFLRHHPNRVTAGVQSVSLEHNGLGKVDPSRSVRSRCPDRVPLDQSPEEFTPPGHGTIVLQRDHRLVHCLGEQGVLAGLLRGTREGAHHRRKRYYGGNQEQSSHVGVSNPASLGIVVRRNQGMDRGPG